MTERMDKALRYLRRTICVVAVLGTITLAAGCFGSIPDQDQFAPLSALKTSGEALVRLYGVRDPIFPTGVRHSWFVIKHADSTEFDRWELWGELTGEYGHVFHNLVDLDYNAYGLEPFIIAELRGPEAEPVVEFIETESPNYPNKDVFDIVNGPNCHTYTTWVAENTGWDVPFQGFDPSILKKQGVLRRATEGADKVE